MATRKKVDRGHAPTMSLALTIYACTGKAFKKIYKLHKIHVHNLRVLINLKYDLDMRNVKVIGQMLVYKTNGVVKGKAKEDIDFYLYKLEQQGCIYKQKSMNNGMSYGITQKGEGILKALDYEIQKMVLSGEAYFIARPKYQYLDQFFKS